MQFTPLEIQLGGLLVLLIGVIYKQRSGVLKSLKESIDNLNATLTGVITRHNEDKGRIYKEIDELRDQTSKERGKDRERMGKQEGICETHRYNCPGRLSREKDGL